MTQPDFLPETLDDHTKTKEKAELFPDEPVGKPSEFRDKIDVAEDEHIRVRTKADDKRDQDERRAKDLVSDEGRVTLRINGEDDRYTLFSCNICSALLLRTGIKEHIAWHERLKHGKG